MKCTACERECKPIAFSEKNTVAVSACCGASIVFDNYTKPEKTLRDEIAIEAMKIALKYDLENPKFINSKYGLDIEQYNPLEEMADGCYNLADAMMKSR